MDLSKRETFQDYASSFSVESGHLKPRSGRDGEEQGKFSLRGHQSSNVTSVSRNCYKSFLFSSSQQ